MSDKHTKKELKEFIENRVAEIVEEKITDVEDSLKRINEAMNELYEKPSSGDVMRTKMVRGPIAKKFGKYSPIHKMSLEIVKISDVEKKDLIKKNTHVLVDGLIDRTDVDYEKIKKVINKLKDSKKHIERAVAMLLASGSRPFELFVVAEYETAGKGIIKQKGVAKAREYREIVKPLINYDPETFVKDIDYIRKMENTNKSMEALPTNTAKKLTKVFIKEVMSDQTISFARKIYGNLSYDLFGKNGIHGGNPSIGIWLNKVLGHADESLGVADHYSTVSKAEVEEEANKRAKRAERVKKLAEEFKNKKKTISMR